MEQEEENDELLDEIDHELSNHRQKSILNIGLVRFLTFYPIISCSFRGKKTDKRDKSGKDGEKTKISWAA